LEAYVDALCIVYGTMNTISVIVLSVKVNKEGTYEDVRIAPELTQICGGYLPADIYSRCLSSVLKAVRYEAETIRSIANKVTLLALREPNFGHHQWNIFSGLLDICEYYQTFNPKLATCKPDLTLAYDPSSNYLALNRLAIYNGMDVVNNLSYSFKEQGPLLPLDAPVPRHNCTAILDKIFAVLDMKSQEPTIIVCIKRFDP